MLLVVLVSDQISAVSAVVSVPMHNAPPLAAVVSVSDDYQYAL
jgi:hypothetical protein